MNTPCQDRRHELRGPDVLLSGLCVRCGAATIHADDLGYPDCSGDRDAEYADKCRRERSRRYGEPR
ncbi:MAG: hypothetical protein ACRDQA_02530 [Nocardioidaceae bacterium]